MASTCSGRARPNASNRRSISFLPSPASMRRVVHPDSSNVELPVLPEAKMDMRNEIRIPQCWRASNLPAKCSAAMDDGKLRLRRQQQQSKRDDVFVLNSQVFLSKFEAVEVADHGSGHAVGLEEFA